MFSKLKAWCFAVENLSPGAVGVVFNLGAWYTCNYSIHITVVEVFECLSVVSILGNDTKLLLWIWLKINNILMPVMFKNHLLWLGEIVSTYDFANLYVWMKFEFKVLVGWERREWIHEEENRRFCCVLVLSIIVVICLLRESSLKDSFYILSSNSAEFAFPPSDVHEISTSAGLNSIASMWHISEYFRFWKNWDTL